VIVPAALKSHLLPIRDHRQKNFLSPSMALPLNCLPLWQSEISYLTFRMSPHYRSSGDWRSLPSGEIELHRIQVIFLF
jgi:hypothetical protein